MGAEESKQDSAVSYDLNEESKGVLELPEELHHGPIHSLAVLDNHHLLSAGTDTVYTSTHANQPLIMNMQKLLL